MSLGPVQHLETQRGRFAWREGGDRSALPVVMIHGWPESSYCWAHVSDSLSSQGCGSSPRICGAWVIASARREPNIIVR